MTVKWRRKDNISEDNVSQSQLVTTPIERDRHN